MNPVGALVTADSIVSDLMSTHATIVCYGYGLSLGPAWQVGFSAGIISWVLDRDLSQLVWCGSNTVRYSSTCSATPTLPCHHVRTVLSSCSTI